MYLYIHVIIHPYSFLHDQFKKKGTLRNLFEDFIEKQEPQVHRCPMVWSDGRAYIF